MRKQLQVHTGRGWHNLSSEFYERGNTKDEEKAQAKMEKAMANWPFRYEPYRDAQFRILDVAT